MTYDWMEDDAAMGAIDTDEEDVEEDGTYDLVARGGRGGLGSVIIWFADAPRRERNSSAAMVASALKEPAGLLL